MKQLSLILFVLLLFTPLQLLYSEEPFVAVVRMDMEILPGTQDYLERSIEQSSREGAKVLVAYLDTPGGMLNTLQGMIQSIFKSPIPVVIYVGPSGSTATSAGVFITLAAHVAVMAEGTSIGAAHPVMSGGEDIKGDMRAKAENMTIAMVRSISEQRGRNVAWAEKAVKESDSITESEALKLGVIDFVAKDLDELLTKLKGRKIKLESKDIVLEDYSKLPRREFQPSFKQKTINVLADPNVAALLWLGATTGLSIELYNPGAILPGVVGVICLILALGVSQIIPISQGGVLLLIMGVLMIGAEFFIPSGVLGVGGIIAIVLGSIYLVDVSVAPDLSVNLYYIVPSAVLFGGLILTIVWSAIRTFKRPFTTGSEGLIGMRGKALSNFTSDGKVFVNGEVWSAVAEKGIIQKEEEIEVIAVKPGLVLEVRQVMP